MKRLIRRFRIRDGEELWVGLSERAGRPFVDVRVYRCRADGRCRPTASRVTLPVGTVPAFMGAVAELGRVLGMAPLADAGDIKEDEARVG